MWACRKCGSNNYDNSNYCSSCGTKKAGGSEKTLPTTTLILLTIILTLSAIIITMLIQRKPSVSDNDPQSPVETGLPASIPTSKFYDVHIGDTITFGKYEQDNNTSNGKEPIEWQVLATKGDRALIISCYALDSWQYNSSDTDVTWETCALRKWLNGAFISSAFSSDEQALIQSTTVTAERNPSYDTPAGNDTTDKVFLLSITEAQAFFSSNKARMCSSTDYAEAHAWGEGAYGIACSWWLRSPGYDNYSAAFVSEYGDIEDGGIDAYEARGVAARPALWINLES